MSRCSEITHCTRLERVYTGTTVRQAANDIDGLNEIGVPGRIWKGAGLVTTRWQWVSQRPSRNR